MRNPLYLLTQFWARILCVLFWGYQCRGLDRIPRRGGLLVVSNHQSFLDLVLIGSAVPRRITYVARHTLRRSLLFRLLTWPFDVLDIRRGEKDVSAVRTITDKLREGACVLVFPEGTRTRDGRLGKLREGFIAVARRGGAPITALRLNGVFAVWPKGTTFPGRGMIRLETHLPLRTDDMEYADALGEIRRRLSGSMPSGPNPA
jgi:1-acyl-sn-glycerol-3-phosphate acyltransferase